MTRKLEMDPNSANNSYDNGWKLLNPESFRKIQDIADNKDFLNSELFFWTVMNAIAEKIIGFQMVPDSLQAEVICRNPFKDIHEAYRLKARISLDPNRNYALVKITPDECAEKLIECLTSTKQGQKELPYIIRAIYTAKNYQDQQRRGLAPLKVQKPKPLNRR